jgi:hypothetical protein
MTRCTPWFRLHLIMQSTDTNRACAASTRFYQVTSLVTNPTIVAALLHILMPEKGLHGCIPIRTVLEKPALEAERVKPRSRPWNASTTALFVTAFLLMHVQGNQKLLVCLEEKQSCRRTEQRKQLAHEVPDRSAANATGTHRGRLYTARASPRISCVVCGFGALYAVPAGRDRTRGLVRCSVQEIRV